MSLEIDSQFFFSSERISGPCFFMSSHTEDRTACSWCDDEIGTESALVCSSLLLLPVKKDSKPTSSSLLQINILQVVCSEEMTH